ncbi:hypothetical protein HN51_063161 [Arachis hypogaea]
MVLKSICERIIGATCSSKSSVETIDNSQVPASLKVGSGESKYPNASLWSGFFPSGFLVSETHSEPLSSEKKAVYFGNSGWAAAVWKVVNSGSMRRFQERVLGTGRTEISSSDGFDAIGDSKYTSDFNWGCMFRSSQMLVAQALLFHKLGRSWRKNIDKVSHWIKNILRSYKVLVIRRLLLSLFTISFKPVKRETDNLAEQPLPMAIYVVSGDEDGERGGAPVVCIEDASKRCSDFSRGKLVWTPLLLLVPLVLGLDKINPRYIPLLQSTFKFPQSLGILGGKPGASTYLIGVQGDKALYLDPHEVQQVVNINGESQETSTSSYHSNVIRHIPLDSINPSLAIGSYCRDKDDFDDFCSRASKLAEESNGALLITVAQSWRFLLQTASNNSPGGNLGFQDDDSVAMDVANEAGNNEDDWQLL